MGFSLRKKELFLNVFKKINFQAFFTTKLRKGRGEGLKALVDCPLEKKSFPQQTLFLQKRQREALVAASLLHVVGDMSGPVEMTDYQLYSRALSQQDMKQYTACNLNEKQVYTVMQSDRNSLKTDTFHKLTTYEPHVSINSEQIITFAVHEFGRVGVFRIKIRSLVQKFYPLEKCQLSNCSYLIASHCI